MDRNIEELVDIYKRDHKFKVREAKEYEDILRSLIKNKNNDNINKYLVEGPKDNNMKVLMEYRNNISKERGEEIIKSFINSKEIEDNKQGLSGNIMVYLLEKMIAEEQDALSEEVFLNMVKYAYKNKQESINKKVSKDIKEKIFPFLYNRTDVFDLSFIDNEKIWEKTKKLFMETASKSDAKNKEEIYNWLKSAGKDMGEYKEKFIEDKTAKTNIEKKYKKKNEQIDSSEKNKKDDEHIDLYEENIAEDKDINRETDMKLILKNLEIANTNIISMKNALDDANKEINIMKVDLKLTRVEVPRIQKEIKSVSLKCENKGKQINELRLQKDKIESANKQLEEKIIESMEQIEKLKTESNEEKIFFEGVINNRKKEAEENLNKIASELKFDYKDYCDAENMEMTIDLGENMRTQLDRVFSILCKNGIKIK